MNGSLYVQHFNYHEGRANGSKSNTEYLVFSPFFVITILRDRKLQNHFSNSPDLYIHTKQVSTYVSTMYIHNHVFELICNSDRKS